MTKLQQLIEAAKAVTHSTARTRARKDNCEPYKSDWNARRLSRADLRLCRKSALARRHLRGTTSEFRGATRLHRGASPGMMGSACCERRLLRR